MTNRKKIKGFVLFWLDGKMELVHGETIKRAFQNAGYGAGALAALDFYDSDKNIGQLLSSKRR